jgi:hypothetical protein
VACTSPLLPAMHVTIPVGDQAHMQSCTSDASQAAPVATYPYLLTRRQLRLDAADRLDAHQRASLKQSRSAHSNQCASMLLGAPMTVSVHQGCPVGRCKPPLEMLTDSPQQPGCSSRASPRQQYSAHTVAALPRTVPPPTTQPQQSQKKRGP